MKQAEYLMENEAEADRLEIKTRRSVVERHARWAGLLPGMRVADIGCGPGMTTHILQQMVQPGGQTVGVDFSGIRIARAKSRYRESGISFYCMDVHDDLSMLGTFDMVWVRFLLEYQRSRSFEIVRRLERLLRPGGILCLIDLDQNCLNHYDVPPRLARTLYGLMDHLARHNDFDPEAGRKLYTYLYDLGFENIDVHMEPHHLIFGEIGDVDYFNWEKKVATAGKNSGYPFTEYKGDFEAFYCEFNEFFTNPRRFTYTPVICCRGRKPQPVFQLGP